MQLHLAFVKLQRSDDLAADVAARLTTALREALAPWSAQVLDPADPAAAKAWDLAVVLRAAPEEIARAMEAIEGELGRWPVAVTKGWSFQEIDP